MFVHATETQYICENCADILKNLGRWVFIKRTDIIFCEICGEQLFDVREEKEEF